MSGADLAAVRWGCSIATRRRSVTDAKGGKRTFDAFTERRAYEQRSRPVLAETFQTRRNQAAKTVPAPRTRDCAQGPVVGQADTGP
jgi:hypothetical protein